ncbi:MAG: hypothetical protein V1872_07335 [bacterium]
MYKLFTKRGCDKCDYVKGFIPKQIELENHDIQSVDGLAELAELSLVGLAEKELPILVTTDKVITGAINIKKEFSRFN